MEGEKFGSADSLGHKTLAQLRELLDRQEKLASNPKLLNKLPDKGHKVLQFLQTLRHVVAERQGLEASVSRQPIGSASTAVPQLNPTQLNTTQLNTTQLKTTQLSTTHLSTTQLKTTQLKTTQLKTTQLNTAQLNTTQLNSAQLDTTQLNPHLTATEPQTASSSWLTEEHRRQGHSVSSQGQAVDRVGDGEMVDTTTDISQCLQSLTVSELAASRMSSGDRVTVAPDDGGNLETRFPNSYETVMKRNSESGTKKSPFKPNSSLNISHIEDLPEAYKLKSKSSAADTVAGEKAKATTADSREGRPAEESAVVGPAYRFAGAKELTIHDSISLQKQQQEQLEKLKSMHAAEKLAERLNIKTAVYNPTAVDMDYRNGQVADDGNVYDSDDVPEDDVLS